MKKFLFIFISLSLALAFIMLQHKKSELTWETVNSELKQKFPEVQTISVDELKESLENKDKLILIDVRTPREFASSHIFGAINIEEAQQIKESKIPENEMIVAYCSVGYRSAIFLEELKKLGYHELYNLKGSIFEWANRDYPLYKDNELTQDVHPYNDY